MSLYHKYRLHELQLHTEHYSLVYWKQLAILTLYALHHHHLQHLVAIVFVDHKWLLSGLHQPLLEQLLQESDTYRKQM